MRIELSGQKGTCLKYRLGVGWLASWLYTEECNKLALGLQGEAAARRFVDAEERMLSPIRVWRTRQHMRVTSRAVQAQRPPSEL